MNLARRGGDEENNEMMMAAWRKCHRQHHIAQMA